MNERNSKSILQKRIPGLIWIAVALIALTAATASSDGLGIAIAGGDYNTVALKSDGTEDNLLSEDDENDLPGQGDKHRADPCDLMPDPPGKAKGHDKKCPPLGGSAGVAKGDFNGDGTADLAVGVSLEDIFVTAVNSTIENAGGVHIIHGSSNIGLDPFLNNSMLFLSQNTLGILDVSERNDMFGKALASGNFNGDAFSDLAIIVFGEISTIPGTTRRVTGAIQVLYGSATGLTSSGNQFLRADQLFLPESSGSIPRIGDSLVWGDFNHDGFGDLAIEGRGSGTSNAPVSILFGSNIGLNRGSIPIQHISVGNAGFSTAEGGSIITELSLAAGNLDGGLFDDLAVGTPFATVNGNTRAGAVHIFVSNSTKLIEIGSINQDSFNVQEVAELDDEFGAALSIGNFNGDAIADLAIGVPFEDVNMRLIGSASDPGTVTPNQFIDAGVVHIFNGSFNGSVFFGSKQLIHEERICTIEGCGSGDGQAETGDNFGAALAAGNFNNDGFADLAVGAPNERIGGSDVTASDGIVSAGSVNTYYGSSGGLQIAGSTVQFWHEGNLGIGTTPVAGDRFGASLTAWNFGRDTFVPGTGLLKSADLAIGVPRKEVSGKTDAGLVRVIYSKAGGLTTGPLRADLPQTWHQDIIGIPEQAEANDRFGETLY